MLQFFGGAGEPGFEFGVLTFGHHGLGWVPSDLGRRAGNSNPFGVRREDATGLSQFR